MRKAAKPSMKRGKNGNYASDDHPSFTPNVSPAEMFQAGIFGGTYFRDIKIGKTCYRDAWKEFEPYGWFHGLDIAKQVSSDTYTVSRNRYKARCGQPLDTWVEKGWIKTEFDSHGWVHWYCRFFLGRRCADDERQVSRWRACAGAKGRWKRNLIAKCVKAGRAFDDESVSPTVRQLLLHWGYQLTESDFSDYKKLIQTGHRTSFIPQSEMEKHVIVGGTERADQSNDERRKGDDQHAAAKRENDNDARERRRLKRARRS